MRRATLAALLGLLFMTTPVWAAHIFVVSKNLEPNKPNQTVTIQITGGETVATADLFLKVGDGTAGPKITNIDLTSAGLIFAGGPVGPMFPTPYTPGWTAVRAVEALDLVEGVVASGNLAYVNVTTEGLLSGNFELKLEEGTAKTGLGAFVPPANIEPVPVTLTSGTLSIVPEPAVVMQLLALAACVPLALGYRRWRRAA